tara:strand:+ start:1605 stop:2870 length:1266 start_codon:yes stop_codon:yes gene_type:complete
MGEKLDNIYSIYGITDNPFPKTPTIRIDNPDKRMNGSIFFKGIFPEQISKFRELLENRTNMIYVRGFQYNRGDGKSALMAHAFYIYKNGRDTAVAFIRCTGNKGNVRSINHYCIEIIRQLHQRGYLWKAFSVLIGKFISDSTKYAYTKPNFVRMFKDNPTPPYKLKFTAYTTIYRIDVFTKAFTEWISENVGCNPKFAKELSKIYLTNPANLEKDILKKNSDKIEDIGNCLKMLKAGGFDWCYFFLDQMEDSLNIPVSALNNFTSSLRRVLEKSSNYATIVATLHPESARNLLDIPEGRINIQSFAPLNEQHYVMLYAEDMLKENRGGELIETYMREFAIDGSDSSKSSPIDPQVSTYITSYCEGNLRDILRTMHHVILFAANKKQQEIDMNFIKSNHKETMGKEFSNDAYQQFLTSIQHD